MINLAALKRWFLMTWGRWLIKRKKIRESLYTIPELQGLIDDNLPQHFSINVPAGEGDLLLLDGKINLDNARENRVQVQVLASLEIFISKQRIYRGHIRIDVSAKPFYRSNNYTLYFHDCRLDDLRLVDDSYFFVETSSSILDGLLPAPFKDVLGLAIGTAVGALNMLGSNEIPQYLAMFTRSGKQKVLDYHRDEIEQHILSLISEDTLQYTLDPDDYEEALFIELGQDVVVRDKCLAFRFHK